MIDIVRLVQLLLLICGRPLHPADGGDGHQDPGELQHLWPMALHKQGALVRIQAEGDQRRRHLPRLAAQSIAVMDAGKRVVIDDAVDGLVSLLQRHIVPNGAQVIPQVRRP